MSEGTVSTTTRADSWMRLAVQSIVIVITTWQLFAKEIHGYIDNKVEVMQTDIVRQVTAVGGGQSMMVLDSAKVILQQYQDTNNRRFDALEERTGLRPLNKTIVQAADTVGMRNVSRRLDMVERGIEQILDGLETVPWKRKKAHNERENDG